MGWKNKIEPPKPDPHPKCLLPKSDGTFISGSEYECDTCKKVWTYTEWANPTEGTSREWRLYIDGWYHKSQTCS